MTNSSIHVIPGQTIFYNGSVPDLAYIIEITNAQEAVVTFFNEHSYSNGELISFRVAPPYGMIQINNQVGKVISHDDFTVTVDIDTLQFFPFVFPIGGDNTPPFTVPAGSGVIPGQYVPTVTLFDVFDNLPPAGV